MNVPNNTVILVDDSFSNITISGYKTSEVKKALNKAITSKDIPLALRWTAELHSSGFFNYIQKIILNFSLDIESPIIFFLLNKYFDKYDIIKDQFKKLLETRNNQECRNLLSDLIYIICSSNYNNLFNNVPIIKNLNDYTLSRNQKDYYILHKFFSKDDRKEFIMAINEIDYFIDDKNSVYDFKKLYFWIHWLNKVESFYDKENYIFYFNNSNNISILSNGIDQNNFRWGLWLYIIQKSNHYDNNIKSLINSMLAIYKYKITKASIKNRQKIIMSALILLKNQNITPLIKNMHLRIQVCCNSNIFYEEIAQLVNKRNDVSIESILQNEDVIDELKNKILKDDKNKEQQDFDELRFNYLYNYDAIKKNNHSNIINNNNNNNNNNKHFEKNFTKDNKFNDINNSTINDNTIKPNKFFEKYFTKVNNNNNITKDIEYKNILLPNHNLSKDSKSNYQCKKINIPTL